MRLLMVSEPGEYGVLAYVRNLVRFLHRHCPEIAVDLAFSSRRGSPALDQLVAEIAAHDGETLDLAVGNAPEWGDFRAWLRLQALIRRRRPDLIHAHSSKAGALTRLLRLPYASFPPVLYSPHGYYGMSRHGGLKERLFNRIESVLGNKGVTHHVSSYEREFACRELGLPPRSQILVYTGIDGHIFSPASSEARAASRRELGLPAEGKLLVTVGRNAFEKNYASLYAALDTLLPDADWNFAHAGNGAPELRATLRPAARARAFSYPYLDTPERLLHAADGFILTSRSEAFGLTAYEALLCGLPLILTASTGLLSLRRLGFEGVRWLPDPVSTPDLAPFLREALHSWSHSDNPISPARKTAAGRWFDQEIQFGKLKRIYRLLCPLK